MPKYSYLIPVGVATLYMLYKFFIAQKMRYYQPFDNKRSNALYNWSFAMPFKWFIQDDNKDPKIQDFNLLVFKAGLSQKLDYRSFTVLQSLLMGGGLAVGGLFAILYVEIFKGIGLLINTDFTNFTTGRNLLLGRLIVFSLFMLPSLLAKFYIKHQNSGKEVDFLKDLPLLQTYIILMLRSDKTIAEIFSILSTTRTTYQETFQKAYRIWLAEPSEGFDYLEDRFGDTKMADTIYILRDLAEYDKLETVRTLENNQVDIIEFSKNAKKKAEAGKNLMTQLAVAFPFGSVLILGAGPVAYWAMQIMAQISSI